MFYWNLYFSLQFNTLNNALARCPHCRKISSVGPDFARGRGIVFIIVGVIALVIAIAVTVSVQFAHLHPIIIHINCSTNFILYLLIVARDIQIRKDERWNLCSLCW